MLEIRELIKSTLNEIFNHIESRKDEFISDKGVTHKIEYNTGEEYSFANYIIVKHGNEIHRFNYRFTINGVDS